jgi:Ca2+:H+ antiporter
MTLNTLVARIRREWFLGFSVATSLVFLLTDGAPLGSLARPAALSVVFLWLFGTILGSAMSAVRHADHLAARLGEPYGTLILTISVTFIEVVSIAAVMLHGKNSPTLARDTLFAVVMIVLNGMVGLSLLLGGWRHHEQHYNLQGANAYLGVIIPLVVLTLILPNFTQTTPGPTLSVAQQVFLAVAAISLYATFLAMQTGRHRSYFALEAASGHHATQAPHPTLLPHAALLIAYMVPVVVLADELAHPVDYLIGTLHAPVALGGAIMAVLVATPEAIGAVRAATQNDLQRSVNIFLGSVLATISLTVPAMILVSNLIGRDIALGLEHTDTVMLLLTLAVSVVTFASGRTNVIQGAVHLILFATYLLLIVQG